MLIRSNASIRWRSFFCLSLLPLVATTFVGRALANQNGDSHSEAPVLAPLSHVRGGDEAWVTPSSAQPAVAELGALGFEINPGLAGLWFEPETTGQGIFLEILPAQSLITGGWFTYGEVPGEGQRWWTLVGAYSGDMAELEIFETSGGVFDSNRPVTSAKVGEARLDFESCDSATLEYNLMTGTNGNIALRHLLPSDACNVLVPAPGRAQHRQAVRVEALGVFGTPVPVKEESEPEAQRRAGAATKTSFGTDARSNGDGDHRPEISIGYAASAAAETPALEASAGLVGLWYNPATTGQGLMLEVNLATSTLAGAWFTYGRNPEDGKRWFTLVGPLTGARSNVEVFVTEGGVFDQPSAVQTTQAGTASVEFPSCDRSMIRYALNDGSIGTIELQRLSPSAYCRSLQIDPGPLPDLLDSSQATAIVDVSIVPMTGQVPEVVMNRQVAVIENGVIQRVGRVGEVPIPPGAVQIDGRGLFLGPGLTEMHLHISTGGQRAAEDAGLLLIANGVTSVLNMGDGFSVGVPALGDRFESGELIGPSLMAGNTAYGTPGNGVRTVATPAAATAYATLLANSGYEFIKEYWQLQPLVLEQFERESERLGLPIVGHIPLTRPMAASLSRGQRMAAHIQEPYVSYMNYQTNPALIGPAAEIFLENRTYLTPTMAVFESYRRVFGGDAAQFALLSAREGQQYTAPSVKQEWSNFFRGSNVQGPGLRPGGYDRIYAFFEQIAREFFDAGVPILIGTDGPGFPGVMSGYGVHVEMDLLRQAGLPTAGIYSAATRNAGQFAEDTLHPAIGFGTIEAGRRADLNLLAGNPLESLDTLRTPVAVMSRGRFWSREYLQSRLAQLATQVAKRGDGSLDLIEAGASAESNLCVDHFGAAEALEAR